MKYFFVCFCLLLAISASSNTVEVIRSGSPDINAKVFKPYKNRWKMIHISKDGSREQTGTWTDEGTITLENGRRVFQRVQDETSAGSHFITINFMDLQTLTPIRSERKQELGENAFDIQDQFHGTKVTSTCTGKPCQMKLNFANGQATRTMELDEPVFDYLGGVWGMLFPAFPLKENSDLRFPAFSETKGLVWIDIHIRGMETVEAAAGKKVQAWAVEWPKMNWVFWITQDAPYVIKLITPDAEDGSMSYEMF